MNQVATHTTPHRRPKIAGGLAGLGLIIGLGWTLGSGLTSPPAKFITSNTSVELALPYSGICSELKVRSGEQELHLTFQNVHSGLAQLSFELPPGEHKLTLEFIGVVPGLVREYPLLVDIDQEAPELIASLHSEKGELVGDITTAETLRLTGKTEPGSILALQGVEFSATEDGTLDKIIALTPGWNHFLLSSRDRAGNQVQRRYSVFRDVEHPTLTWRTRPDQIFEEQVARLEVDLVDDGEIVAVSGLIDGSFPITWHAKADGHWVGLTPELHEGFHEVTVRAVDRSGKIVESQRQVVIDSTEKLGEAVLGLGARGADVRLLHQRLMDTGYLAQGAVGTIFDKETAKAIAALQEIEGLEVTGRAERETLAVLGPRIFINLSNFSLVLERPGQEQKRWRIASGTDEHPTPVGRFQIVEKVYDPTWLPPKSEWAKDAEPIPPGPDNPLGSRWLGFDWGGVGIHGTNAPWSVGTAASHGCMRMMPSHVEELFDLVEVGTPVVVLGGWETDPLVEKYWPNKALEETVNSELASN